MYATICCWSLRCTFGRLEPYYPNDQEHLRNDPQIEAGDTIHCLVPQVSLNQVGDSLLERQQLTSIERIGLEVSLEGGAMESLQMLEDGSCIGDSCLIHPRLWGQRKRSRQVWTCKCDRLDSQVQAILWSD